MLKNYYPYKALFVLVLGLLCLLPDMAKAQGVVRIAAVVNDDLISAHDLAQRIKLTIATARLPNTPDVRKRLARSILRTMIDERLKAQEGEKLELEPTEKQLQTGMLGYAQSLNIPPDKLPQALAQLGIEKEILEDVAHAEISWGLVVRRLGRERIQVTDKEVNAALAELEANKGKPEYLYSEIFLPMESPSQATEVNQLAERLFDHLKDGSPFSAFARDFSKSPSAINGGDLGWVQSGSLSRELENALSRTAIGGYSNPVQTPSGIFLLHLRDKRISGQDETDEILTVSQVLLPSKPSETAQELADRQYLARTLAQQAQSCDQLDAMGKEIGTKHGRVENIKLSTMPPALRKALGPIGKNRSTITEQENMLVVLMVCERQNVAPPPEIVKKREMKQRLRLEKIGREDRRLLQKLRRAAFVDIRL